jgi:hypothetical protein
VIRPVNNRIFFIFNFWSILRNEWGFLYGVLPDYAFSGLTPGVSYTITVNVGGAAARATGAAGQPDRRLN